MSNDYMVEMRNRFKELDLIDRVPDELWTEVHEIVGNSEQDHPQEKKIQTKPVQVHKQ